MLHARSTRQRAQRLAILAGWIVLLFVGVANAQDSDGDRLPDAVEAGIGTDPARADTDSDGDSDWLEYYRCRSPLDAANRGPARCRAAVGGPNASWAWSENGPVAGMNCLRITNAIAPAQWPNTYLCTISFTGWRWSQSGPIAGLSCVAWQDSADPAWNNNLHYLCGVPVDAPLRRWPFDFAFVASNLQQDANACVRLANAAAPAAWSNNYFCHRDDRVLYEDVACLNCASPDLANGALLTLTARRTTGDGISAVLSDTTVDGEACAPVAGQSMQCRLPAGRFGDLGKGRLLETFAQRLAIDFPPPLATTVTPTVLPAGGGEIVIDGEYFGIAAATVTVGGQPCAIVSRTPTAVSCQAPPRPPGSALVVVTVGNQSSNALTVVYRATPTVKGIGAIGPAPTAGGGRIVVLGSNLDTAPTLTVGGAPCQPQSIEFDLLICRMPVGRGTAVPVVLTVGERMFSGSVDYDPPEVSGVVGAGGPTAGGIIIGVVGRNFGNQSSGVTVSVGASACQTGSPGTGVSHTRIDCQLPPGQGSAAPVEVTVLGRQGDGATYAYAAPTLQPFGDLRLGTAGGELLEVRGSNLGTSGTVRIAGAPCSSSGSGTSHGHGLIRCRTPEGLGLDQPVTVEISGQFAQTVVSYRAPTLTGGQLASGPTLGGNEIVVNGSDLGGASLLLPRSLRIGGAPCEIIDAAHDTMRCRVSAGQGRDVPLVATVGTQPSNALAYTYRAPVVTDVVPGTLPTSGQIVVTVRGQDFGPSPTVRIGTAQCQVNLATGHVQASCAAPPGAAGPALLRVDAGNQSSNAWPVQYDAAPVMVTLVKGGDGFGRIASTPAGLACDATCTARENLFPPGTAVTLSVQAEPGSAFLGWQGPCSGSAPTCSFTATADTVVTATFGSPLFGDGFEPTPLE